MDTWTDWQTDWPAGHSIFQFELHFNQFGSVHFGSASSFWADVLWERN